MKLKSALLWCLLESNLPEGIKVNKHNELVIDGELIDGPRKYLCHSDWWGYTIKTSFGTFNVLGYQLKV